MVHAAALDTAVSTHTQLQLLVIYGSFSDRCLWLQLFSVGRVSPFPTPLTPLSTEEASGSLTAVLHDNIWVRHASNPPLLVVHR